MGAAAAAELLAPILALTRDLGEEVERLRLRLAGVEMGAARPMDTPRPGHGARVQGTPDSPMVISGRSLEATPNAGPSTR